LGCLVERAHLQPGKTVLVNAATVIVAIAKAVEDARPVRFVHVGGASRGEK